jgi:hypothetical protein
MAFMVERRSIADSPIQKSDKYHELNISQYIQSMIFGLVGRETGHFLSLKKDDCAH